MDDNTELAHPPDASDEFTGGTGIAADDDAALARGAPAYRGIRSPTRYLRLLGFLLFGAALVAAGVYGWRWWGLRQLYIATDNAQVKAPLVHVSSKIAGRLEEVTVVEGDRVQPGQVIARLDRTALADQVRAAEAALGQARNRLVQAQTGVGVSRDDVGLQVQQARQAVDAAAGRVEAARMALVAQESQVTQQVAQARAALAAAQAEVERYETAVEKARRDLERLRLLHKDGAVATRDVDDARTELETAGARVRAAKAQVAERQAALDLAVRGREMVEVRRAELMQAQALHRQAIAAVETTQAGIRRVQVQNLELPILREQVAQAEATLRVAKEALDSAVVTARQAGVVVQRGAHPGEYVQPGRTIVVLADL
ncbi:MAG: biotin/lipoyl-binding protein, partial [Armatimonadetes bacterium]|nr:biotin/lipoyl-binding protein [Armatimonadota bacterium]